MDGRLRRHNYGFLEVVSPPDVSELTEYYKAKYYQAEHGNYRASYSREELDAIRLRISLKAQRADELRGCRDVGRLLDVGCGEGFVLDAYSSEGWFVRGIDHSAAGVLRMNKHIADRVDQGDLFTKLEEDIKEAASYDLVWLVNVLEHVTMPIDLLLHLRRLVATDGLLIVTVPNDGSEYHELLWELGLISERFWIAPPEHLSYFTSPSLVRSAEETGWKVLDLQGDFPIDVFLSHSGSNYVEDKKQGPAAHAARLNLEKLIGKAGPTAANAFYSSLASVGLGRNITAYLAPSEKNNKA